MTAVNLLKSIPYLLTAPSSRIWIDYDEEADVLYISFRKPQRANDSLLEDNIIALLGAMRYNKKQIDK
ncbi:DUF2283 domain-containing protein [Microcystis sp. LEGE 08355]|uniref:DUF2283 domain-containing protein n=1 Tax=Microcystis sp. LEGE 08355 TaxID=1828687 RepID=UPI001D14AAFD|nr:DUF2283 domain-containing protein [Microcystis sp. LEGE 08355]